MLLVESCASLKCGVKLHDGETSHWVIRTCCACQHDIAVTTFRFHDYCLEQSLTKAFAAMERRYVELREPYL